MDSFENFFSYVYEIETINDLWCTYTAGNDMTKQSEQCPSFSK